MSEACSSFKHGVIDLSCSEPVDHDKAVDGVPGTWHSATATHRTTVEYPNARHEITMTEKVDWKPVDHVTEAVSRIIGARGES